MLITLTLIFCCGGCGGKGYKGNGRRRWVVYGQELFG